MVNEKNEKETYVRAYTAMVLSRTFDKKIVTAQRQGRIGFYTPSIGQEATQVGVSMALDQEDVIFQYYRDVALMIHRGVPLEILLNQIMGNAQDESKGRQMPSHYQAKQYNFMSVQSPVATNLPLAVGAAYALRYQKASKVVVATFGDGSTSTPDFHAALNLAAVFNLPVVFVCENNGWAISMPTEKQTKVEISEKAVAYGMKGIKVDGNNFIDTYRAMVDAVERARSGKGPTLIDAISFRMGPHSTSDDPGKYRSENVEEGSEKDPITVAENQLKSMGYLNDALIAKIREEAYRIVTEKFDTQEKVPGPELSTMFEDVYAEKNWIEKEEEEDIA